MICLLVPGLAMALGMHILGFHETTGEGVQWESIWVGATAKENFSIADSIICMLGNGLLYMIIAFYNELVFPGDFGVPLPWYFFLTVSLISSIMLQQ